MTDKLDKPICDDIEKERLLSLLHFEEQAYKNGFNVIAGIDEAGRGPLAGPVVAAACVLPRGLLIPKIDDSKKLVPIVRKRLYEFLINEPTVQYAVGIVESTVIDEINIYQATIHAMWEAIKGLSSTPDCLLVDGVQLDNVLIPSLKIIKGDQLSQSIAAASIIAKETRDALMLAYHEKWPEYGFASHKGYGTKKHLDALKQYGPCSIHRFSFAPIKQNLLNYL